MYKNQLDPDFPAKPSGLSAFATQTSVNGGMKAGLEFTHSSALSLTRLGQFFSIFHFFHSHLLPLPTNSHTHLFSKY